MKAKLIFLFFTVFCLNAHAQNWSTAWAGGVQYYLQGNNVFSCKVTKIDTVGGKLRYYFSPLWFTNHKPGVQPWCSILNHTSKVGQYMLTSLNGDEQFINIFGDTLLIKTQAELNDEWIFYTYPNGAVVKAKVMRKDWAPVVDIQDSVKWIELNYFDSAGVFSTKEYNSLQVAISKNHGWIKRFTMNEFPFYETIKNSVDSLVGLSNPNRGFFINYSDAIYNYEVGDEWCYSRNSSTTPPKEFTFVKITGKSSNTDFTVYTYIRKTKWEDFDTLWYTFDQGQFTVNNVNNYETPFWGVQVGSLDNTWPFIKGIRGYRTGSDSCTKVEADFGGYYNYYVLGVDRYFTYSSMGGVQWDNKSITYIKKGNKIWGTPFNFGSLGMDETIGKSSFTVYPNPVKGVVLLNKKGNYAITDLTGKKLIEVKDAVSIDMTNLPMGIYFIYDATGGRAKLMKQ